MPQDKTMSFETDHPAQPSNYAVFHRYWICQDSITPLKKKLYGKLIHENGSSGSTVYKCRLVPQGTNIDYGKYYAMKVVSYMKEAPQKKQKKNKDYRPINPYTKTLQMIQTQYLALQMLNKCHRIAKFKQLINQNSKRQDDHQFFYDFLKKPKCLGQKHICIVTQFCNEGDLDSIVQGKNKIMSQEQVICYASQIIEGLYQLKKKRIIHRDLRLCNILVHNGQIKFSDFDTAFIGGKSNWKDVKSGIDIQTSPPQIIQLASKPDEQLKRYDQQDLYQRQQKSDIYFFGLALFKMIYGYNYQKFSFETLSNIISEKLESSKYNKNLLNLLVSCLQQKAQKRINFETLYKSFIQIEKTKYFDQRIIDKLYLSEEPICFASYKTLDTDNESISNIEQTISKGTSFSFGGAEIDFDAQLKKGEHQRMTLLYKDSFAKKNFTDMDSIWKKIQNSKIEQRRFVEIMQNFIQTISIRSYYYQCVYKAILCINMRSLKIKQDIKNVNKSKSILQQELTIVLSFLFKILFRTPFTRDERYCPNDLPYQTMKLFKNIIKSDFIQNKMHCYFGKSRQFDYKKSRTTQKITQFFNKRYEKQDCFQPVYNNIMLLVNDIDKNLKNLLKSTIINLRIAYANFYKKQSSNIRQILFILIVLQQINLQKIKKNQLIVMWDKLLPILNEEVELDKDEANVIFQQYKKLYSQDQLKINGQHNLNSVTIFAVEQQLGNSFENMDENDNNYRKQIYNKQQQQNYVKFEQKVEQFEPIEYNLNIIDPNNSIKKDLQFLDNQKFEISTIKQKSQNMISVVDKINQFNIHDNEEDGSVQNVQL